MAEEHSPENEMFAEDPAEENRNELEQAKAEGKAAQKRAKAGAKTRLKAEKTSTEDHSALATAQTKVEVERQSPPAPAEQEPPPRDFFVVRVLEFDKVSETGRLEIEHNSTGTKRQFFINDGEIPVAFIKAHAIPTTSPREKVDAPTPEPLRPASSLTVSDIRVLRLGVPGVMTLSLRSEEAAAIQVRFQVQGPDAPALTVEESPYEVKVYANSVTGGVPALLATQRGNLVKDILSYTAQMRAPGLTPGLYRLFTLVTLHPSINKMGYRDGPIVEVMQEQEIVNTVIAPQSSLAR